MILRAMRSAACSPAHNLALEEVLLEDFRGDAGLLLLYVNDPCVVIGRNQNPWAEASPRAGLPVFRRVSGGGAVYHDAGNLNWCLIVPREEHDPEGETRLVAAALKKSLGLDLAPGGKRGGLFGAPGGPLAGRKVSGEARRFAQRAVLHHGTLLVDADHRALVASSAGMETRDDRSLPSEPSPTANLSEAIPGLDCEGAAAALCAGLGLGVPDPVAAPDWGSGLPGRRIEEAAARHGDWEWVYGKTPQFLAPIPGFPGLAISVKCGRVSGLVPEGAWGARAFDALVGERFSYETPRKAADIAENTLN